MNNTETVALVRALAPAYLRLGGTPCDTTVYGMPTAGSNAPVPTKSGVACKAGTPGLPHKARTD
jgi:hypothetical protein